MKNKQVKRECMKCKNRVFKKGLCRGHFGVAVAEFVGKQNEESGYIDWEDVLKALDKLKGEK